MESAIKINPILLYSIFREAKAVLNEDYLDKYKNIKVNLKDFSSFIKSAALFTQNLSNTLFLSHCDKNLLAFRTKGQWVPHRWKVLAWLFSVYHFLFIVLFQLNNS